MAAILGFGLWHLHTQRVQVELGNRMVAAVEKGDFTEAGRFLDLGADPNAPITPIKPPGFWVMLRSLFRPRRSHRTDTVLILAAAGHHSDTEEASRFLRDLLEKSADTRVRDSHGRTPLMLAALFGHPDSVRALIEHGVDVNERADNGWSTLDAIRFRMGFTGEDRDFDKVPIVKMLKQAGAR